MLTLKTAKCFYTQMLNYVTMIDWLQASLQIHDFVKHFVQSDTLAKAIMFTYPFILYLLSNTILKIMLTVFA